MRLVQTSLKQGLYVFAAAQIVICGVGGVRGYSFSVLLFQTARCGGFPFQQAWNGERLADKTSLLYGICGRKCSCRSDRIWHSAHYFRNAAAIDQPSEQAILAGAGSPSGTQAFLNNYFAWFGCAVFLVIILTFDYAIQSNLRSENRPDISRMWYILAGFLAFVTIWIIRLLTRFLRTPQESLGS